MRFHRDLMLASALVALLSGCDLAPVYTRPTMATIPAGFKEAPGWRVAAPADAAARGDWWLLFDDPALDALERQAMLANQDLAAASAAYDQARAAVREQRAGLFPGVDASASGTASDGSSGTLASAAGKTDTRRYSLTLDATWEPDFWGRIGNTMKQAGAQAEASHSDLANAVLSIQGELALDYVQLRAIDAQKAVLDDTVAAYERALAITHNLYDAGVAARSDVLQAETALHNARAQDADLDVQRAALEHAIAVLAGQNPSGFRLPVASWKPVVPEVPSILPSELLQRRPDVAAAERRVAAANAQIGIQRAAYFPSVGLSASKGFQSSGFSSLFSSDNSIWSLGLSGVLSLLDFGARSARADQARAAYAQSVAQYRQTALTAFQQTEDQLAAVASLETVSGERVAAARSANHAEEIARNQYQAGLISYSSVIVTQTTALSARTAEVQAMADRQVAAISLIQAIGGDFRQPAADTSE